MSEKEKLRQWINRRQRELKKELDELPNEPGPKDLARYDFIGIQILILNQMKTRHFPPEKDPDPRFLEVLY